MIRVVLDANEKYPNQHPDEQILLSGGYLYPVYHGGFIFFYTFSSILVDKQHPHGFWYGDEDLLKKFTLIRCIPML